VNPLAWLSPGRWLLVLGLAVALMVGLPLLKSRYDAGQQEIGYERRADEDRKAAEEQTARNRELQRAAELRYTVTVNRQVTYFTQAAKEVHDAAAPLATCPVPPGLRLRLNAAAGCARGDPAATCGDADGVPAAR
jgi:hypothetical protein